MGIIEDDSISNSGTFGDLSKIIAIQQLIHDTRTRAVAVPRPTTELNLTINQQPIPFRTTVTALFDDQNELLGTLAVMSDVREEKSAKARHAEFVSSVAHEFKTPMASIKAFLELLVDGGVSEPDEQKAMVEKIDYQVDRLNRLVSNLLNLARIESGAVKLTRDDCDLNDVIQRAAEVIRPLAEERGQQFVTDLSQLYLPVNVDRDFLGQAIINLLSNAVKYTPEKGRITLRSHMEELEAIIEVEDTGYGIPPESLPKIFDSFYRVPEHQHAAKGTEFSLAFVQSIAEDLHNGHINVESTVGVGSKFSMRIPLGHQDSKRSKKPAAKPEPALANA